MIKEEFLLLLNDMLELDPHTLKGPEHLTAIGWDSLAVMNFIALLDEQLGCAVSPLKVAKCQTVNDLIALWDASSA